jgi:hypothetical protein
MFKLTKSKKGTRVSVQTMAFHKPILIAILKMVLTSLFVIKFKSQIPEPILYFVILMSKVIPGRFWLYLSLLPEVPDGHDPLLARSD